MLRNILITMIQIETYFHMLSIILTPWDKYQPEITLTWLRFLWVLVVTLGAFIYFESSELDIAFKWVEM